MKTNQAYWYWIFTIYAIITLAVVLIIPENLYPWSYMRIIFGAIFILYLPGYALIKALFPLKIPNESSEENIDIIERIALNVGASLILVPIVGLLLNYTPWGMRLFPVVLCLFIFSLIFASIALFREYQNMVNVNSVVS